MSVERVFLGWELPALRRAAEWLRQRYIRDGVWNLSEVALVTPGSRAGRRLLEVLVDAADGLMLLPPRIITPGDLPELLYRSPEAVVIHDLRRTLVRAHVLSQAEDGLIKSIIPDPPEAENVRGWWNVARELERVYDAVAAGAVELEQIPALCRNQLDFPDEQRWVALDQLDRAYQKMLDRHGLTDRNRARLAALKAGSCAAERDIVLVCTADLDQLPIRMLRQAAQTGEQGSGNIFALIHAPESEAATFDELGCLLVDSWSARQIDPDPRIIRIVDRPRDQAYETLRQMESFNGRFAADQITIGVGDDKISPMIARVLEIAGISTRSAIAREVSQSAPVMLLTAMARFIESERFDDFASLLRHPDIEEFLLERSRPNAATPAAEDTAHGSGDWLTLLDDYITDHLQGRLSDQWLGEKFRAARLKKTWETIRALVPADHHVSRPLPEWATVFSKLLERVYSHRELNREIPDDRLLLLALQKIADAIRELAELDAADPLTPSLSLVEATAILISCLTGATIPPLSSGPAVELLGWLELQLDDAPVLIVTGVNEGYIPESVRADAFLPDRTRRFLGLVDNRRRLARDKYAMYAILRSRPTVRFISGRRGSDDNPLTPSRLLLSCSPDELPRRVLRFYDPKSADTDHAVSSTVLESGKTSRFIVPPPQPPATPINRLYVTAFRDYLRCPYRFYLQHVLKLKALDDRAVELDAASFGNLAHEVLQMFGDSDLAVSSDADAIGNDLLARLGELVRHHYGDELGAAVMIQTQQLSERLRAFARWHAAQTAQGWRIVAREQKVTATIDVDGQPFEITGKIDRIDRDEAGRVRIADYKTGDKAAKPEAIHRKSGEWVDLQLPLYRVLVASLNLPGARGEPVMGYIQLPRELSSVGFTEAKWSQAELDAALETAAKVVRGLREGVFWPPTYPVDYMEDFAGICLDDWEERETALSEGNRLSGLPKRSGR